MVSSLVFYGMPVSVSASIGVSCDFSSWLFSFCLFVLSYSDLFVFALSYLLLFLRYLFLFLKKDRKGMDQMGEKVGGDGA